LGIWKDGFRTLVAVIEAGIEELFAKIGANNLFLHEYKS
jgi:hypothetical protein